MQQTKQNCVSTLIILALGTVLSVATAAGAPASDPLLTTAKGPCDPKLDGPDYVAGTDVDGNPVAPADMSRAKIPAPSAILMPLGGETGTSTTAKPQAYAELSQKDVDSILNPKPACPSARGAR